MLCSLGLLLIIQQPQVKAAPTDQQSQKHLQDYLKAHHINGVMLVNGKGSQPITITNNENANHRQTVKADQLFPIASLQKNHYRNGNLPTETEKAAWLGYAAE